MIQFLNIQKDSSIKQIDCHNNQCYQLLSNNSQQVYKDTNPKFPTKTPNLKTLFKLRNIQNKICQKMSVKSSSLSTSLKRQKRNRYDCQILKPPEYQRTRKTVKSSNINKQNRPASTNDCKNPSEQFVKHTLYNTQKIQSYTNLPHIQKIKKEINNQEDNVKENINITNLKLASSNSRSKVLKFRKKQSRINTESKIEQIDNPQSDFIYKNKFRKDIIDQIFNKVKIKQTIKTDNLKSKCYDSIQSIFLMKSMTQQSGKKKDPSQRQQTDNIFHADYSTIEEKQDCNASFISKKGYRQFKKYLENFHSCQNDPTQPQIRKKIEMGRFRKRFPQNFFK